MDSKAKKVTLAHTKTINFRPYQFDWLVHGFPKKNNERASEILILILPEKLAVYGFTSLETGASEHFFFLRRVGAQKARIIEVSNKN